MRLTNTLREDIIDKAVKYVFSERVKEIEKDIHTYLQKAADFIKVTDYYKNSQKCIESLKDMKMAYVETSDIYFWFDTDKAESRTYRNPRTLHVQNNVFYNYNYFHHFGSVKCRIFDTEAKDFGLNKIVGDDIDRRDLERVLSKEEYKKLKELEEDYNDNVVVKCNKLTQDIKIFDEKLANIVFTCNTDNQVYKIIPNLKKLIFEEIDKKVIEELNNLLS